LLDDELRVALHKQLSGPKGQSGALPEDEGLIFCHVVGCFKLKMHHVLELFSVWSKEQGSRTGPLLTRGGIEDEDPVRVGEHQSWWLGGGVQSTTKSTGT
jgi:hypothetical protein